MARGLGSERAGPLFLRVSPRLRCCRNVLAAVEGTNPHVGTRPPRNQAPKEECPPFSVTALLNQPGGIREGSLGGVCDLRRSGGDQTDT